MQMTEPEALARAREIEPIGWLYKIIVNKHVTGPPLEGQIQIDGVWGTRSSHLHFSPQPPQVNWIYWQSPVYSQEALAAELRKESDRAQKAENALRLERLSGDVKERTIEAAMSQHAEAKNRAAALEAGIRKITQDIREQIERDNPEVYKRLGKVESGYLEGLDDIRCELEALSGHSGALDEALAAARKAALMEAAVTIEANESLPLIVRMRSADRLRALAERKS